MTDSVLSKNSVLIREDMGRMDIRVFPVQERRYHGRWCLCGSVLFDGKFFI